MTATRINYPTSKHAEADRLLAAVAEAQAEKARIDALVEAEFTKVRGCWQGQMDAISNRLAYLGQKIETLEKEHQAVFFDLPGLGSCSLDLPHGTLLYAKEEYVVKPRKVDVLGNLRVYGLQCGIRKVESVDWDVLATWPDERLALAGTERRVKETFGYEVKEQGSGARGQGSVKQEEEP